MPIEHINKIKESLSIIKSALKKTQAKQITSKTLKDRVREFVSTYFREDRPLFIRLGINEQMLVSLDNWYQYLLELTQKNALKSRYNYIIKATEKELNIVETSLVLQSGVSNKQTKQQIDGKEILIAKTLYDMVPSAGSSYEQACIDLSANDRISYRGAAAELREALREILDHLAPDKDVMAIPGFKFETEQKKPTMKQKVRFILRSRGKNATIADTPEATVGIIEDRVGALARSIYNRSSLSTHVGTTHQEVSQIKAYVDVVLCELLEIS